MHYLGVIVLALVPVAAAFLVGFVIEAISAKDEPNTANNLVLNALLTIAYFGLTSTAGVAITTHIAALGADLHLQVFDLSRLSDGRGFLGLGVAALWLTIYDFVLYWVHRAQHSWAWLWAEHAVHHSDGHMGVTTSYRHHWLEVFIQSIFVIGPIVLFVEPPSMLGLSAAYILTQFHGYFIHLNSRISFGPLNRLIANPSVHRIHHSRLPEHLDKNFAVFFPMWDVIFGTYYAPRAASVPTGLSDGETIDSAPAALFYPFQKWAQMLTNKKPQPVG